MIEKLYTSPDCVRILVWPLLRISGATHSCLDFEAAKRVSICFGIIHLIMQNVYIWICEKREKVAQIK